MSESTDLPTEELVPYEDLPVRLRVAIEDNWTREQFAGVCELERRLKEAAPYFRQLQAEKAEKESRRGQSQD